MSDEQNRPAGPRNPSRRPLLFGGLAVATGIAFGYLGPRGWNELTSDSPSSPRARVGYALENRDLVASDRAWTTLASDVKIVRSQLSAEERPVFDMVVAETGLETRGHPNAAQVQEQCKHLKWPRCDAPTLTDLKKRLILR